MKKHHFLNQPSILKKEALSTAIQKTIKMMETVINTPTETSSIVELETTLQAIKQRLQEHSEDLSTLNKCCSLETITNLQDGISSLQLIENNLTNKLNDLNHLVQENTQASLKQQLSPTILTEISEKFLSINGGNLKGTLNMNNNKITGLPISSDLKESDAVSVGYTNTQLQPLKDKLNEVYEKTSQHESAVSSLQFQMMPVAGGKFRGHIDMDGFRISGLGMPKNARDAVPLEYLEKYVQEKNTQESPVTPMTQIATKQNNLLYSSGINPKFESPLTLDLLTSGIIGFSWKTSTSTNGGYFPFNALRHNETQPNIESFHLTPTTLSGIYPGIYTWFLTFKALVPSTINIQDLKILMSLTYHNNNWNPNHANLNITQPNRIQLLKTGYITLGEQNYDIVEFSESPAGYTQTLIITPNCTGFSLQLKNVAESQENSTDLYIIQAAHCCSWSEF
ncbi:hypothetical protein [Candidatus Chlamydia sanziniae]|uniref:Uncharacterized protein n=1 Tax=Candidatus Chlamydia sanziniae TaxID=1806891 RepID=A0A1A9HWZ2_9CHLA|nr:hypothetical protein [Candidatus Chlamydia sanziniae]ANH78961.1 hypothetical protein Cs308_0791 [Candidatus Chlamydia sanziniae]